MTFGNLGNLGRITGALALVSLLSGCIGVKLTAQGAMVRQGTAESVASCELVGKVSSAIPSKTLNTLAPGKIQEQLIGSPATRRCPSAAM